ncbi:hypothetical protein KQX54_021655 [Cotesia glomerata]|uniref:Uncharacterized protein n=1 Tax=Cotesia glomerata TaxID=32391 RepID=A0AAV7JA63_COTGL|nr:hypothetical protein KQX54_021655 [Cotesia glomerata]
MIVYDSVEVPTDITRDNIYQKVAANLDEQIGTLYITTDQLVWIKDNEKKGFRFLISDITYAGREKNVIDIEINGGDTEVNFSLENKIIRDSICKKIENAGIHVDDEELKSEEEKDHMDSENDIEDEEVAEEMMDDEN